MSQDSSQHQHLQRHLLDAAPAEAPLLKPAVLQSLTNGEVSNLHHHLILTLSAHCPKQ